MISFATSATSQTDYIHTPQPARRTKGVWSLSAPMESPYLVDRSEANYLPNATQERPAFLRTDPSTSTGCTDGSPPVPFQSRGKELPSSGRVGNRRDREVVRGTPDHQFTASWRAAASLSVPRSAPKPSR